jgi:site-specific DNA-methyltransferase (adenine-specific)
MKIERLAITELKLDPNNARKHDETNLDAIAGSLTQFGQRKPIVISKDNTVVAGNGTVTAAQKLGWQEIDVVRIPAEWDADRIKAFALADNRSAELAAWDVKVLNAQLMELVELDFDIQEIGFEMPQVLELETQEEEELPEPPADPVTKLGDVWQLGEHRLICGDSLELGTYDKLLGEEKADMVWTDPPYGVSYVGKTKDALTIENDTLNPAELESFLRDAFTSIFASTRPGACWYVAAPSGNLFQSFSIPLSELDVWKHTLVWVKNVLVMGRADYHYRHESIFYGWTPGAAHQPPADRKQDSVWEVDKPRANKVHPTMKPVELITRAIQNSSRVGEIVLDSFGGSGSTLIAAEQTKRKARLIELDPKYCDVIVQRWETLTGLKAELVNASR